MKTTFDVKGFNGAVLLKDWRINPYSGASIRAIVGKISLFQDEELVGFKARGSDSNFIFRVESSDGSRSCNILGCQVSAVVQENDLSKFPINADMLDLNAVK